MVNSMSCTSRKCRSRVRATRSSSWYDAGQPVLERGDRQRRAAAGDHVLALRVEQVLAVERALAGGRIAAEGHAGARVLAQVAEHHRHDVDRGAHAVGDVVQLPVVDGPAGVPALEHGRDGAPELVQRIAGEVAARLAADVLLEPAHERLHLLDREIDVALDPAALAVLLEDAARTACASRSNTTLPYICTKRRYESQANCGFLLWRVSPSTVTSLRPRLRMVSIIPGMDTAAPDRTLTSSGLSPSPKCLPVAASTRCRAFSTSIWRRLGNWWLSR